MWMQTILLLQKCRGKIEKSNERECKMVVNKKKVERIWNFDFNFFCYITFQLKKMICNKVQTQ
jgi:hypothetical protein